jgi:erythritol transport system permease protein
MQVLRFFAGGTTRPGASQRRVPVTTVLLQLRAFAVLIILIVGFGLLTPRFLAADNLVLMVKHASLWALLAIGETFVILTAGIDLSVGSIVALTGMVAGGLLYEGLIIGPLGTVIYFNAPMVIFITLGAGCLIGLVNGLLIVKAKVPPFIATLGMLYVVRGLASLRTNGATFPDLSGKTELGNTGFEVVGGGQFLGLPVQIYVMVAIAAVGILVSRQTAFGRHIYAVGGNARAALLAGIRVGRVTIAAYVISGFCAAVAGIVVVSQLGAANPAAGEGFELTAIAAVVLGGTSLFGGRGTVLGSIVGAFVIGFLGDGLVLLGVTTFWQTVVIGLVIITAVIVDQAQQGWERRREIEPIAHEPSAAAAP